MRILIVEDEELIADRLERLSREILGERLVQLEVRQTLAQARATVERNRPDLVLLDLNLSGRDGFELLGEAVAEAFHTIVVSAQHEQAVRAFEYGVVDFVPKPFGRERLALAFDRVDERDESLRDRLRHLAVRKAGAVEFVEVCSLQYVQGSGDYSELHVDDGRQLLHDKTLSALEQLLPRRFVRVHRSFLVDLDRAVRLHTASGGKHSIELAGDIEIPVSRSRVERIRRLIGS